MNLWECEHPGCKATASGIGGAIGLRAIGWYFQRGPRLLCPHHRPDGSKKRNPAYKGTSVRCKKRGNCGYCKAEEEADKLQYVVAQATGLKGRDTQYYKDKAERWDKA